MSMLVVFIFGIVAGVVGLISFVELLMWRYPSPDQNVVIKWNDFYSEGLGTDPRLGHSLFSPPPKECEEKNLDSMIEEDIGHINPRVNVAYSPSEHLGPSEESTLIHEAGHAVMVLKRDPLTLRYAVTGGFVNHRTGHILNGMVVHGETSDHSNGLILYAGHAAEMVFFGKSETVLMGSDLANAFAQAYFVHWIKLLDAREAGAPWPPMHPWCALGALGSEHRDPKVLEAVMAICDDMRQEAIRIITEEREAVKAIADALEEHKILKRQELFAIWDKFHPGEIARLRAREEASRNR